MDKLTLNLDKILFDLNVGVANFVTYRIFKLQNYEKGPSNAGTRCASLPDCMGAIR